MQPSPKLLPKDRQEGNGDNDSDTLNRENNTNQNNVKKRKRMEKGNRKTNKEYDNKKFPPLTESDIKAIFTEVNRRIHPTRQEKNRSSLPIPSFRVGTLEMYKRFPGAYHAFMHTYHNCAAVEEELVGHLLPRLTRLHHHYHNNNSTETPTRRLLRVLDFGCGSGRFSHWILRAHCHSSRPFLHQLVCCDKENAMLRECLLTLLEQLCRQRGSTVQPSASWEVDSLEVHLPSVDDGLGGKEKEKETPVRLSIPGMDATTTTLSTSRTLKGERLSLSLQPFSFEHILHYKSNPSSPPNKNNNEEDSNKEKLPSVPFHFITLGWTFSYVLRMFWQEERWKQPCRTIIEYFLGCIATALSDDLPSVSASTSDNNNNASSSDKIPLDDLPIGAILIVETLGNSETPTRTNKLMEYVESTYQGFIFSPSSSSSSSSQQKQQQQYCVTIEKKWCRTDYQFPTLAEAENGVVFFFGDKMKEKIKTVPLLPTENNKKNNNNKEEGEGSTQFVLEECTGMWILWAQRVASSSEGEK